ncbi:hypothetical protein SDC9_53014 [bioreactor metagenome]|uniref:Uncharacterized protein n=1 Tax=bioreactor metagenome TaxID=1076179 RepID=A0A644WT51_9ZZZZ
MPQHGGHFHGGFRNAHHRFDGDFLHKIDVRVAVAGDNKRVEAGFVLPQKPDHSRGGHGVILVGGDEG